MAIEGVLGLGNPPNAFSNHAAFLGVGGAAATPVDCDNSWLRFGTCAGRDGLKGGVGATGVAVDAWLKLAKSCARLGGAGADEFATGVGAGAGAETTLAGTGVDIATGGGKGGGLKGRMVGLDVCGGVDSR